MEWLAAVKSLPWATILTALKDLFTVVAIVVGGAAAYYQFLRGRTFRPRLETRLTSSILQVGTRQYLKVFGAVRNTGASKIDLDLQASALRIFAGKPRIQTDEVAWGEPVATLRFTERHKWIEPGETITETWLISLADALSVELLRAEVR